MNHAWHRVLLMLLLMLSMLKWSCSSQIFFNLLIMQLELPKTLRRPTFFYTQSIRKVNHIPVTTLAIGMDSAQFVSISSHLPCLVHFSKMSLVYDTWRYRIWIPRLFYCLCLNNNIRSALRTYDRNGHFPSQSVPSSCFLASECPVCLLLSSLATYTVTQTIKYNYNNQKQKVQQKYNYESLTILLLPSPSSINFYICISYWITHYILTPCNTQK